MSQNTYEKNYISTGEFSFSVAITFFSKNNLLVVMKFELLPNEIIINCFDYLNAPDLFNAFDGLNYRFQRLITNIPLTINFQRGKKATFDQFCQKMLSNPQIKNQIYSLQLTNTNDTCDPKDAFLSLFSLEEFSHLRLLNLSRVNENDRKRLESLLSSLSNLFYLRYDSLHRTDTILSTPPSSNVRKLDVPEFSTGTLFTQKSLLITHLTVSSCNVNDLSEVFKYAPMLKYLKVTSLKDDYHVSNGFNLTNPMAVSLTQLNLRTYHVEFNHVEMILKQTPNLKILTLHADCSDNKYMIDANRWENLISSSLPHLHIFRFHFIVWFIFESKNKWITDGGFDKYKQFENDFWTKQHHWYTAYELNYRKIAIFTVPYREDYHEPISDTELYCDNSMIDESNLFDNVTRLRVSLYAGLKKSDLKFSNVHSLTLNKGHNFKWSRADSISLENLMEFIKNNVSLSKLRDLELRLSFGIGSASTFFLEILKDAPHLSSISIYISDLLPLLNNDELCTYFNKMITKLQLHQMYNGRFIPFDQLKDVWKIFSNVEKLTCSGVSDLDNVVELLNRLPKLLNLCVWSAIPYAENTEVWLRNNLPDLDANFELDSKRNNLNLWIGRRMN